MAEEVHGGPELVSRSGLTHTRPAYGITSVRVGNRDVPVTEEALATTPFGTLLHFKKDIEQAQPRVLVVAPLSGHFATLLRSTVQTLLADHDVCITDWHNARDATARRRHVRLRRLYRPPHPMAARHRAGRACAGGLPALRPGSSRRGRDGEAGDPAKPMTMTLMAGPIDTRVNPTKVNELATGKPMSWFENNLISSVPRALCRGRASRLSGLRAAPGVRVDECRAPPQGAYRPVQASRQGRAREGAAIKTSTTNISPCSTCRPSSISKPSPGCFRKRGSRGHAHLPRQPRQPEAIRRTMLLTVEGERDDICSIGQTSAAHQLCTGLRPHMKRHHLQVGVGHYGVFSGRRWENQVYPQVKNTILAMEPKYSGYSSHG